MIETSQLAQPELLAPAGTLDMALTAFDYGADAVYVGLPRFNARERGRNLTLEEVAKLVAYARRNSRRVYVALNTLIKESELHEVVQWAAELARIRPHAVMVQELGVLTILRRFFPELPVHASTQMGVHNSAAIQFLNRAGIKRVILERQVTFEEMRTIAERSPLELEVFVHGALCCSRSGECLWSSWLGGWSGNRGKCKQPCRRRFYTPEGNGFFFSTKDLCLLESIPELKKIGISALKIEGRLRNADYVRHVIQAYRMVLDQPVEAFDDVLPAARNELSQAHGRKWSRGFTDSKAFGELIDYQRPGAAGQLCGEVTRIFEDGFRARLKKTLAVGDRIRLQPADGGEGAALTVSWLATPDRKKTLKQARRGDCFVYASAPVPERAKILRISSQPPDHSQRIARLTPCRAVFDLTVVVKQNEVKISVDNYDGWTWHKPADLQSAVNQPLTSEKIGAELRRTLDPALHVATVIARIEGDFFVPASTLKEWRREFWDWVQQWLSEDMLRRRTHERCQRFEQAYETALTPAPGTLPSTLTVRVACGENPPWPQAITARHLDDIDHDCTEVIVPGFCSEHHLEDRQNRIQEACRQGVHRFRVESIGALALLQQALSDLTHFRVTATFPLPVTNSVTMYSLGENGVDAATVWIELERYSVEDLVHRCPGRLEIFRLGRVPVLTTRAEIPASGTVTDDHGHAFRIEKRNDLTVLLPSRVLSLPHVPGTAEYYDLERAACSERDKGTAFNYWRELV